MVMNYLYVGIWCFMHTLKRLHWRSSRILYVLAICIITVAHLCFTICHFGNIALHTCSISERTSYPSEYDMLLLCQFVVLCFSFQFDPVFIALISMVLQRKLHHLQVLKNIGLFILYHQLMGISYITLYCSYGFLMTYLEAITHLWYHVSSAKRYIHFGGFLYRVMQVLEKMNVISTESHRLHHAHDIHTLDDVEFWADLWVPTIVNKWSESIWKRILGKHVPGQHEMIRYSTYLLKCSYIIVYGAAPLLSYIATTL